MEEREFATGHQAHRKRNYMQLLIEATEVGKYTHNT